MMALVVASELAAAMRARKPSPFEQLRFAAVAAQTLGHAVGWRPLPGDGFRVDPGKLIREVIEAGQPTAYERCRGG